MLNSTSYIIKAHKPIRDFKDELCEYQLSIKHSHLHVPIGQKDLEDLYQSIQDALFGKKITA